MEGFSVFIFDLLFFFEFRHEGEIFFRHERDDLLIAQFLN